MSKLNIKQRLGRALRYSKTISHLKHYKGYGVHSPFAYALKRNVFNRRDFMAGNKTLYEKLTQCSVGHKRAVQLQNLYSYCSYKDFVIDGLDKCEVREDVFYIATKQSEVEYIEHFVEQIGAVRLTLCVVYPRHIKSRHKLCKMLVAKHNGMSVDNIGFMLYFYNDQKRKQHIKL